MSQFGLRACLFAGSAAVVLLGVGPGQAQAQQKADTPNFSWDPSVSWIGVGEFQAVAGQTAPVKQDPKHPFVPNGQGRQPTFRIADLSNPNLKPWAKDIMRKDNDEVLAGKIAFSPSQSCVPAGVPAFLTLGGNQNPYWFVQAPKRS